MVRRDDLAYCPFAYCYSNYARPGYGRKLLRFGDLVTIGAHGHLSTTLGGTGLAISVRCEHLDIALEYSQYVASPECQRTVFFENGGQPGHRSAWTDAEVNRRSSNFFADVLPALDNAYLRPRFNGYMYFQDHAGDYVRDYVRDGGDPLDVLKRLDRLYHISLETREEA